MEMLNFQVGESYDINDILKVFEGRIEPLRNGYWFVSRFIEFQYGTLSPDCKPHTRVIEELKKFGVWERVSIGFPKGMHTLEEKEKEKESLSLKTNRVVFEKPTADVVTEYAQSIGFALEGQNFIDHYEAKGWLIGKAPMKSWKAAVRTWKNNRSDQERAAPSDWKDSLLDKIKAKTAA